MSDELAQIRAQRMAQMQQGGPGGAAGAPGGGFDVEQMQKQQQEQKRMEEMREEMLVQLMTSEARVRMSRIAMVKPDKARKVEDAIIQMARVGQIRGKVDEPQLIKLLEQVSGPVEEKKSKIVFNRRRYADDDDADDDDDY
mmetsp:Transcript_22315/g.65804  ORF Transcript_22315/g.65804 Transcript_22315/m.65804 type:complete len:141 (-) Transcript_22315:190-612(-)